ncbi:MAG TPA: hypothetical protein DEU93_00405 [Chitinophagaceae bacterium]|nr:hypothetical protein [Chitinophagaceae bacterium]HML57970.1 hypothetical protein [Ferruginibacter sp.]
MDVIKFFIGAFFAIGGFNIILFHSHEGRTPGFAILLIVLCIINAFFAGAFLAGARHRGVKRNQLLSGFSEYKEPWSIGSFNPEITNAGAFFLITLCINLIIANLIGL